MIFEGPGDLAAVAQYRSLELFYDRYEVIALSAAGVFSALSIFLSSGKEENLAGVYLGGLVEECGERFGDGCGVGAVLGEGFG